MPTATRIAAAVTACLCLAGAARAQDYGTDYVVAAPGYGVAPANVPEMVPPPLNYNYYYPQPEMGMLSARLYHCPRPTPPHVGYTYITYQAFAPHEFLWRHRAIYYSVHPGSRTTTHVSWK